MRVNNITSNAFTVVWEREPCESRNSEITQYVLIVENLDFMENVTISVPVSTTIANLESLISDIQYQVHIAAQHMDDLATLIGPFATTEAQTLLPIDGKNWRVIFISRCWLEPNFSFAIFRIRIGSGILSPRLGHSLAQQQCCSLYKFHLLLDCQH